MQKGIRKTIAENKVESLSRFPFYLFTGFFAFLISLSFYHTPLVGDEVFVTFQFGFNFFENPISIFSEAIAGSLAGWRSGRFISPISHLASNLGVFLEYCSHKLLQIDLIAAHDLSRLIMSVILVLCAMSLVSAFVLNFTYPEIGYLVKFCAAFILPLFLVSNDPWGGFRLGVWSYTVIFSLVLLLSSLCVHLYTKNLIAKKSRFFLFTILGFQFATLYELSQVIFFPFLIALYFLSISISLGSFGKITNWRPNINLVWLFFGFLIPFLIIRIDSYQKCLSGCYQTASLSGASFGIDKLVNRAFSGISFYAISYPEGNILEASKGFFPISIAVIYLVCLFFFGRRIGVLSLLRRIDFSPGPIFWALPVFSFLSIVAIAIGMNLSRAVQESSEFSVLPIGKSSRDTVYTGIFWALLFSMLLTFLAVKLYRFVSKKRYISILQIWIPFALTFFWVSSVSGINLEVSNRIFNSSGNFLQSRIALEIHTPNLSSSGDFKRCELIKEKLRFYPEWEGHDRSWIYGVNQIFLRKHSIPFCSISAEDLFVNYGMK